MFPVPSPMPPPPPPPAEPRMEIAGVGLPDELQSMFGGRSAILVPRTTSPTGMSYYQPDPEFGFQNVASPRSITLSTEGQPDLRGALRHEALHAVNYEREPYRTDALSGYAGLQRAVQTDLPSLLSSPFVSNLLNDTRPQDWSHVWVVLADAYLRSPSMVPPSVRDYFSRLIPAPPPPITDTLTP